MGERLSLDALEACAGEFDHSVDEQPGIDRFCSRSDWILPFHRAFLPDRELFCYRGGQQSRSFVALASRRHPAVGRYLESVENMWCFACPLVGPDAVGLLDEAIAERARDQDPGHRGVTLMLSGIPADRTPEGLLGRLLVSLDDRYRLRAVDETRRFVASLEGGFEGWLSRRSRSFRKGLRAAERVAARQAVRFEHVAVTSADAARAVYPRILAVEARSWKAAVGNGVDSGPMRRFYGDMLPRLAARGGLRLVFATRDGEDLGYLHGALTGDHFRGLQVSYDRRCERLSLGNLLQRETLQRLCAEGARSYDLGSRSDYKRRWAEQGLRTLTVLAQPR